MLVFEQPKTIIGLNERCPQDTYKCIVMSGAIRFFVRNLKNLLRRELIFRRGGDGPVFIGKDSRRDVIDFQQQLKNWRRHGALENGLGQPGKLENVVR